MLYEILKAQKLGVSNDLRIKLIADWLNNISQPQALITLDNEPITTTDGEILKTWG